MPISTQKGFEFVQKERRETPAHSYKTAAFPVAAAGKETAYYPWGGDFHHRYRFSDCGGGVVYRSIPAAASDGN